MVPSAHRDAGLGQARLDRRHGGDAVVEDPRGKGGGGGGVVDRTETVGFGTLERQTGTDATVVYEGGATYREDRRGQVLTRGPAIRCGPDSAHVHLVRVTGDANVTSGGTVSLVVEQTDSRSVYPDLTAGENGSASAVEIDVSDTRNQGAWEQVFERDLPRWSGSGGTYTCADVNRVFVHVTEVRVSVTY
jgi:hypothetical protein